LSEGFPGTSADEDASKDRFFERTGELAEEMIAAHGKDFAMGVFILAARFIAEGKPVGRPSNGGKTP
jgi:hypothetical protein